MRIYKKVKRELIGNERWAREQGVSVGSGCRILSNIVTSEPWLVSVGHRTTISTGVLLITHDGAGWLYRDERGRRHYVNRISIGSEVFIGAQSVILPGVRIGDRVVVGAGSVVTRSVPEGHVVAGNPARVIMSYDDLMTKIASWPADAERQGASRREQIDSLLQGDFRPEI
ncbi:acyltransferase [Microbacterium sp. C448]|uniref:acyltransferase n=1 Tax=Microbacterium sp. C448 TaxID=1177594 RepID=UPI00243526C6|nr:acyltransferase [Microbacterium sp. C448]